MGLTSYPSVSAQHYGAGKTRRRSTTGVSDIFALHATRLHKLVHASYELILVRLNPVSRKVIWGANAVGTLGAGIA